jgi:hypothetical protein
MAKISGSGQIVLEKSILHGIESFIRDVYYAE